jgi:hypothetical protein
LIYVATQHLSAAILEAGRKSLDSKNEAFIILYDDDQSAKPVALQAESQMQQEPSRKKSKK